MERTSFPFIFAIYFMLLGPLKIVPAFMTLMRDADRGFKRDVAIKTSIIAAALVGVVAVLGESVVTR